MKCKKEYIDAYIDGKITDLDLTQHLMTENSLQGILQYAIDCLVKESKTPENPIVVSKEEMDKIISLFRVKGTKMIGDEVISERRGRPRKMASHIGLVEKKEVE